MTDQLQLSILAPVYHCAAGVHFFVRQLDLLRNEVDCSMQAVVVDDASADTTPSMLLDLAGSRPWLKPLLLAQRHGQNGAITAGLPACTGRLIGLIDGDGDHDPRCFAQMLEANQDVELVNGARVGGTTSRLRATATAAVRHGLNLASTRYLADPTSPVKLVTADLMQRALSHPLSSTHLHEALVLVSRATVEIPVPVTAEGPPGRHSLWALAQLWVSLVSGCLRHVVEERSR